VEITLTRVGETKRKVKFEYPPDGPIVGTFYIDKAHELATAPSLVAEFKAGE
jgi:hypothetical protein